MHLPIEAISGFACYNDEALNVVTTALTARQLTTKVVKKSDWYF
jgi:hypothetical protein